MSRDSGPNVFQRGVMALILLSLLRREDMYGYQLVQETERRSGGRLKTQEGSLYPVLYRLQLEVSWGEGAGERRLRFASLRARYPQAPLEPGA